MKSQYTRTHLAKLYGFCRQTISKLLRERCAITHRNNLTVEEISHFKSIIGSPEDLDRLFTQIE